MEDTTLHQKKVLVAALDWGMGHLTRLTELLRKITPEDLVIACTPFQQEYYSYYFPDATYELIPELNWRWSGKKSALSELFIQRKKWTKHIGKDQLIVDELVAKYSIEVILSDNRYGFYHPDTHNICLTHQLNIPGNSFEKPVIKKLLRDYLSPFQEIWVPDYEDRTQRLSGELSESINIAFSPVRYIGPLSRFNWEESPKKKRTTLLLSGPEPQRRLFLEHFLKHQSSHLSELTVVTPMPYPIKALEQVQQLVIRPSTAHLHEILNETKVLISRAGFTTIMETHQLDKTRKIIVPTPSQREQKYLARHLDGRYGFEKWLQKDLNRLKI